MTKTMIPTLAVALLASGVLAFSATAATAAMSPKISETQARKEIMFDGYAKPADFQKIKDGWTAQALEGKNKVTVVVDDHGDVYKKS